MNTPRLLTRLALGAMGVQLLLVLVIAAAVPRGRGASFLTLNGFVTPEYERGWFSGLRIVPIPGSDPTVYISVQSLTQLLVFALAFAGLAGLVKANPWQHGALPNSTAPGRDSGPTAAGAPPPPPPPPPPAAAPSAAPVPDAAASPTAGQAGA